MVFVKVRETYDLHTTRNKMTVISIHTPKTDIIKRSYPGLLMQCRAYRPYSCDVRVACASMLPLDPLGVGTAEGDIAPEDVFNPILYKAMSNKGMSQLEARINSFSQGQVGADVLGQTATVDTDTVVPGADDFALYYGLLSNTHEWKHANPQSGLAMSGLKPLVYEMVYNVGDMTGSVNDNVPAEYSYPTGDSTIGTMPLQKIIGNGKPMPFINCTAYSFNGVDPTKAVDTSAVAGFPETKACGNAEVTVPYMNVTVGCIIVPPSRLHELFYRMVVEWTLEFSAIRPLQEITSYSGIGVIGASTHYMNYDYSRMKEVLTGSSDTILENDTCMVSSTVDVKKVM